MVDELDKQINFKGNYILLEKPIITESLNREIIEIVCAEPGINVSGIARKTGRSYGVIRYRVFELVRHGIIRLDDESTLGRVKVYVKDGSA